MWDVPNVIPSQNSPSFPWSARSNALSPSFAKLLPATTQSTSSFNSLWRPRDRSIPVVQSHLSSPSSLHLRVVDAYLGTAGGRRERLFPHHMWVPPRSAQVPRVQTTTECGSPHGPTTEPCGKRHFNSGQARVRS
jgi:hypothetical protein